MHAVRKTEHPQHGHGAGCDILVASDCVIETALTELRFTLRHRIKKDRIIFNHIERQCYESVGLRQMVGSYEIEIIRRSVILGNRAELAALQESNRQVEPRRAILALVIPVGREIENCRRQPQVPKNVDNRPINPRIALPASLISRTATVANHGKNEAVFDAVDLVLIASKPGYRADCAWCKEEVIAITRLYARKPFRKMGKQRQTRAVVVGERGVADMGRKQT